VDPIFWKLELKTIADDSVPMESLKGRYLLLNFWGGMVRQMPGRAAVPGPAGNEVFRQRASHHRIPEGREHGEGEMTRYDVIHVFV